jgi:hypothetical protein
VAGKIGVGPDRPRRHQALARPPAADQYRHAAKFDEELRRAARDGVGGDPRAEHLDIPRGRSPRIIADDVNMDRTSTPDGSSSYAVVAQMAEDWATTGRARDKTGTPKTECLARVSSGKTKPAPRIEGGVVFPEGK